MSKNISVKELQFSDNNLKKGSFLYVDNSSGRIKSTDTITLDVLNGGGGLVQNSGLGDLGNVDPTPPADNTTIIYNYPINNNTYQTITPTLAFQESGTNVGDILQWDGSNWTSINLSASNNDILQFSAGSWTSIAPTMSLSLTGNNSGDILYWNGSNWISSNSAVGTGSIPFWSGTAYESFGGILVSTTGGSRKKNNVGLSVTGTNSIVIGNTITNSYDNCICIGNNVIPNIDSGLFTTHNIKTANTTDKFALYRQNPNTNELFESNITAPYNLGIFTATAYIPDYTIGISSISNIDTKVTPFQLGQGGTVYLISISFDFVTLGTLPATNYCGVRVPLTELFEGGQIIPSGSFAALSCQGFGCFRKIDASEPFQPVHVTILTPPGNSDLYFQCDAPAYPLVTTFGYRLLSTIIINASDA